MFVLNKSYLLILLQIRAPFLHINTLLWEGIWGLQAGESNLHASPPASLRGGESMPRCFAGRAQSHPSHKEWPSSQVSHSLGWAPPKGSAVFPSTADLFHTSSFSVLTFLLISHTPIQTPAPQWNWIKIAMNSSPASFSFSSAWLWALPVWQLHYKWPSALAFVGKWFRTKLLIYFFHSSLLLKVAIAALERLPETVCF